MAISRLEFALNEGAFALPDAGRIAVWGPKMGQDLSALPHNRADVITGFYPDFAHFKAAGFSCTRKAEGRYLASVIVVPRARELAQDLIAQAVEVTDGLVIVDGDKTNGVERVLKECRAKVAVSAPISKAHGKVFCFDAADCFADWRATPKRIAGGFQTLPGVFSADDVDPASEMLARAMPEALGGHVVDLGGGWGYLTAQLKDCSGIKHIDLVEADHLALDCARANLDDPRVAFHWHDAHHWRPAELVDAIVTNPPFHTGRKADPDLGRAFIRAAAAMLKPMGQLWLVANRHLPYETEMAMHFKVVREITGDNRFKVLYAQRPTRPGS